MKFTRASRPRGEATISGDKLVSHHSMMFGSIAKGVTEIHNYFQGVDRLSTIACFRKMGVEIGNRKDVILVHGNGMNGLEEPDEILNCDNSGATTRLIFDILVPQDFDVMLTGDESIQKWSMKRIMEPLAIMGADIRSINNNGRVPLKINGRSLGGIHYTSAIPSAQVRSAILLVGLHADGETSVTEPYVSYNHTELMLRHFGASVETKDTTAVIRPAMEPHGNVVEVPGDIFSAVYFIAAGLMVPDSEILIKNVDVNSTRGGILRVCQDIGADITFLNQPTVSMKPATDLLVRHGALHGTEISGVVVPTPIDELPMIAVMACLAEGDTIIRDAAELKVKESDYLEVMVNCLTAIGADVEEWPDDMVIHGGKSPHGTVIDSRPDHCTAMTFAIVGLCTNGETEILGASCVNISYPGFYEDLKKLIQASCTDNRNPIPEQFCHFYTCQSIPKLESLSGGVLTEPDDTVYTCNDVMKAMITDVVHNGMKTLEEVQEATGAGEVCGACLDGIQAIIDEVVSE